MHPIRVPSLAENINEATVGRWLVAEGATVQAETGLVELLTEKAEFTLEADTAGVVSAILAPAKSVMPVGSLLCVLNASAEEIQAAREENERRITMHLTRATVKIRKSKASPGPARPAGAAIRATPAARRLAKENQVDLVEIAAALEIAGPVKEEHVREFLEESQT